MRIIGIDPGYAIVGFGIIEYNNGRFKVIDYGAVTTPADMDFNRRLEIIYDDVSQILDIYKPESLAIEKLYFQNNQKTAIDVAEARGVILLSAVKRRLLIREYTPLEVKKSVTGYGKAVKNRFRR